MFGSLQYSFRSLAIAFRNGKAIGLGSILIWSVTLLLPNMKDNELIRRLCGPDEPAVCEVRLPAQREGAELCYEEQVD